MGFLKINYFPYKNLKFISLKFELANQSLKSWIKMSYKFSYMQEIGIKKEILREQVNMRKY